MDIESLREQIARSLEQGAPIHPGGSPLTDFTSIYLMDDELPAAGLAYDLEKRALVALPFVEAMRHQLFVPFDFDRDWRAVQGATASSHAKDYMLVMAAALRMRRLPTIDDALVKIEADTVERAPTQAR